ncbi:AAA family ATPase [Pseudonocardia alni]|uniref:AAA family ATPase n=1 Tax=Pseudonocardia alni TaxID=33907 RepID=UPI0033C65E4A
MTDLWPISSDARKAAEAHPWRLRELGLDLDALLAEEDEGEQEWRVRGLWPAGGKVVLSAPAKAGKSTLIANLLRCLADGAPLLGPAVDGVIGDPPDHGHPVAPLARGERVFLADVELSRPMLRRWLAEQGIRRTDRIHVEMFRGRADELNVCDPTVRAQLAERIRRSGARVIILDPVGPVLAAADLNEDSNQHVARFLLALDSLVRESGALELLVVHHTGHAGERSRGASAWRAWPDAEWRLTRQGDAADAPRYFAATGRDVAVPESVVAYDAEARRLTLAGSRRERGTAQHAAAVVEAVQEAPGVVTRNLEQAVQGKTRLGTAAVRAAVAAAKASGLIHAHPGKKGALAHYVGAGSDSCSCHSTSTPEAA